MKTNPDIEAEFQVATEATERGLYPAAFNAPEVEVYSFDAQSLKFLAVNAAGLEANGTSQREIIRKTLMDSFDQVPKFRLRPVLSWIKRRSSRTVVLRTSRQHARLGRQKLRVVVQYLHSSKPSFMVFVYDITRYDEAKAAADKAVTYLSTAIESLPDGFVLYDKDDRLVVCNERYKDIYFASAPAMVPGATFEDVLRYGLENYQFDDAIGREEDWIAERLEAHLTANTTVEQPLSDGTWLRIVERPTKDGGRVGLRTDITEIKQQQEKLLQSARTDQLTATLNRRGLSEDLAALTETIVKGERIAVLHIDLDKFKSINDAQGHSAGDYVLRHCARILGNLDLDRKSVARVGGDEFIVTMVTDQSDASVLGVALRVVRSLSHPVSFRDRLCNFGASIGIAFYEHDQEAPVEDTLIGADIALNQAKRAGSGVCRIFEDSMRKDTLGLIDMAQQIRIGLEKGQFEPFFQPQVDVATGRICGFESLIRWRHPDMGLVPAFKFLSVADWAGLMDDIDHVVMDRSCHAAAQIKSWGMKDMAVSINMSMGQLREPSMLDRFMRYTKRYGIAPTDLRIELLESILLDERTTVITDNVRRLVECGIDVELDDFGTGHAAIATLRKFQVSRIKIDRSLIQDIDTDQELQVITGAIIALADRLGISPLAEGIETPQEQQKLLELGCSVAQGYLHAKPMPLVQLRAWITAHLSQNEDAASAQMPVSE